MKPVTINQAALYLAYRNDCDENNRWNLYAWSMKYMGQTLTGDPSHAAA